MIKPHLELTKWKAVGSFRFKIRISAKGETTLLCKKIMSSLILEVFKEKLKEHFPLEASWFGRLLILRRVVGQICYFPKLIFHWGNREHIFCKNVDLFYKTRLEMKDKNAMIWAMMRKDFFLVRAVNKASVGMMTFSLWPCLQKSSWPHTEFLLPLPLSLPGLHYLSPAVLPHFPNWSLLQSLRNLDHPHTYLSLPPPKPVLLFTLLFKDVLAHVGRLSSQGSRMRQRLAGLVSTQESSWN